MKKQEIQLFRHFFAENNHLDLSFLQANKKLVGIIEEAWYFYNNNTNLMAMAIATRVVGGRPPQPPWKAPGCTLPEASSLRGESVRKTPSMEGPQPHSPSAPCPQLFSVLWSPLGLVGVVWVSGSCNIAPIGYVISLPAIMALHESKDLLFMDWTHYTDDFQTLLSTTW